MGKKCINKDGYIWIVVNIILVFNLCVKFCLFVFIIMLNYKVGVFDLLEYLKYMYIWLNNVILWGKGWWLYFGCCYIFWILYFYVIIFILIEYF